MHDQIVLNYCAMNNISFHHLNNPTTHRFAGERIKLKSDKYYRTSVLDKSYNGAKFEVGKLLDDTQHISCTTDIWTNSNGSLMRCDEGLKKMKLTLFQHNRTFAVVNIRTQKILHRLLADLDCSHGNQYTQPVRQRDSFVRCVRTIF